MASLSKNVLYYGSETPLPEPVKLRAGALSLVYDDGTIRYIKLGDVEVMHQVYSALRDQNWGTIAGKLTDVSIEQNADSFRIQYTSAHQQNDIDFVWQGAITGESDGTITFSMDGEARSTFKRARIGFCILHPASIAGQACTVLHVDGSTEDGAFPDYISPHQPFFDIRSITHEAIPGVKFEIIMEGDTFEMEDQRNWTDASYKTYCTPLRIPFPVVVEKGTKISQKITMKLHGDVPEISDGEAALTLTVGNEIAGKLPAIGLGAASHGEALTQKEISLLQQLNLAHIRVDLRLSRGDVEAKLKQAADEASAIETKLEAAVFLSSNAEGELSALRQLIDSINPPVARWLIFHEAEKSTSEQWVKLAREHLGDYGAPIGAGTDAFFTELNRERPPVDAIDFAVFSSNPQVHAFDNASLADTAEMIGVTVESARHFCNGKPIVVSPVTFFMRSNPNATGPEPPTPPGELPTKVDVRQMSLFGAGWTLANIKYLAESNAESATFFETTGWLGVMERESGSPVPDKFKSIPGGVYPMWHVFDVLGSMWRAGSNVYRAKSSDPLRVDGIVLQSERRTGIYLANLTAQEQTVTIKGVSGAFDRESMDETNVVDAMINSDFFAYNRAPERVNLDSVGTEIKLLPYAFVMLDSKAPAL